jgi:hypothetical protein
MTPHIAYDKHSTLLEGDSNKKNGVQHPLLPVYSHLLVRCTWLKIIMQASLARQVYLCTANAILSQYSALQQCTRPPDSTPTQRMEVLCNFATAVTRYM